MQKLTCISQIHLDVINVKCLATMKISVADKRYASTAVCLNIANLVSVKDLPSVPTAQVLILLTQKKARNWRKKRKFEKIKCEQNISFLEVRKQYKQFYQARTYASAVKPGTCNKSTETDNKTTQTDDSFTEYLKQQTQEKQKEPPIGKPQEKGNPSRPGQTLKPATLEMIRKEGGKKKKEEKEKLKKQEKDESNITKKKKKKKQKKQY